MGCPIGYHLHNLKKCENHLWRNVTFSQVAGFWLTLLKVEILHGCFSLFLNCTNGTKLCKASHNMKPKQIVMDNFYLLPPPVCGTIDVLTISETKLYALFLSA